MASSGEQIPDSVATQLALLHERLQTLEDENQAMRSVNASLQKQLEQANVASQQQEAPGNPINPLLADDPSGSFQDDPDNDTPPNNILRDNIRSRMTTHTGGETQLAAAVQKELTAFRKEILSSIPGVKLPTKRSRAGNISDTPFHEAITMVELPKKFSPPEMKQYDGSTDPDDHIIHYRYKMMSTGLPSHQWEAGMCRGFGETLAGPALTWFINLPYKSVGSYQELADKFVEHFASSCKIEKTTDDLNAIHQRRGETLRAYVSRFNKERILIPDLHQPTAVEAFRNGLLSSSGLIRN